MHIVFKDESLLYYIFNFLIINLNQREILSCVCSLWHYYLNKIKFQKLTHLFESDLSKFTIKKLKYLGCLSIDTSKISHINSIKYLPNLTNLTYLYIGKYVFNIIKDDDLKHIETLTHLKTLKLISINNIRNLEHIAHLTHLNNLWINSMHNITDIGFSHLSKLTQLTELNISECSNISDNGCQILTVFTNLKILDLSYCNKITNITIDYISEHLISLEACWSPISKVNYSPNLEYLSLGFCRVNLDFLVNCHNLNKLILNTCGLTSTQYLNSLSKLEYLDLGCSIYLDEIIDFKLSTHIKYLSWGYFRKINPKLDFILNLTDLQVLRLGAIDEVDLEILSNLNLEKISFKASRDFDPKALSNFLSVMPKLQSIIIHDLDNYKESRVPHIKMIRYSDPYFFYNSQKYEYLYNDLHTMNIPMDIFDHFLTDRLFYNLK